MHLFLRRSALGALLLALTGLAFTSFNDQPAETAPGTLKATHTITVEYQQTRGDTRRASLKIAPREDGVRPLWRGKLDRISVLTTKGRWIIIESFLSSGHTTGHHAEANVMFTSPGDVPAVIILHPEQGAPIGWKVEEGESYTEVEWTYFNQRGQRVPAPSPLEADGGDDDCGPIPAGCEVYNPWTCSCDIGLKEPSEKSVRRDRIILGV